MKFTIDWLKEYVDIDGLTADNLAEKLTMLGLEVDGVVSLFEEIEPIRTARILTASPHPDAEKLQVCTVAVGNEVLEIVCGAPNARKNMVTAVALPGTTLPGDLKIKRSKVRGIVSNGMLCSEKELGLSNQSEGIIELPAAIEHGIALIDALKLRDIQIEVDLTPNRSDCASVIGIAREVAGFQKRPLRLPLDKAILSKPINNFTVEVEAPELCPRYACRCIKSVTIAPSPLWLRNRLLSVGLRPINNIVDVTNFVMMEYGQPLHAFDLEKLVDNTIIVRTPRSNEKSFTTLDGKERSVDPDTLLICDGSGPVALAGIMGGLNSEVTSTTTDILLESACFNDVSIRKTARKLKISTDASYRFERGVDPEGTINALNRATQLICDITGGTCLEGEGLDIYPGKKNPQRLPLRTSRCNNLTGLNLSTTAIIELLQSIGFQCKSDGNETVYVTAPSFRRDIEREADLIEEVARLYGYDNIPLNLPTVKLSYPEQERQRILRKKTGHIFTALGYSEAINYSFCSESHLDIMQLEATDLRRKNVRLLNPLSEEQAVMRTMLLPGLLENVKRNINFQKTSIKLFETGKVFLAQETGNLPLENNRVAGVMSGNLYCDCSPLYFKPTAVDIFDIKGCLEQFFEAIQIHLPDKAETISFQVSQVKEPYADHEQVLEIRHGQAPVGSLGKIKNDIARGFGIKQDVYYFDINFDRLCSLEPISKIFAPLPVYPSVKRDIALVVENSISSGELLQYVRNSGENLIECSEIFDVYMGEKIKEGFKSVALSITYRSANKTLTEKNVEKTHAKIVKSLTDTFGGQIREA